MSIFLLLNLVWLKLRSVSESIQPVKMTGVSINKPFPSLPGLCIKTRLSAQPLIWK